MSCTDIKVNCHRQKRCLTTFMEVPGVHWWYIKDFTIKHVLPNYRLSFLSCIPCMNFSKNLSFGPWNFGSSLSRSERSLSRRSKSAKRNRTSESNKVEDGTFIFSVKVIKLVFCLNFSIEDYYMFFFVRLILPENPITTVIMGFVTISFSFLLREEVGRVK